MSSAIPTGPTRCRVTSEPPGLARLNTASPAAARAALLSCCGSRQWAAVVAARRPYPDLGALLAAADEAARRLTPADLAEALGRESTPAPPDGGQAIRTALHAAHAAYERTFGHAFVICLDHIHPDARLTYVLTALRTRLGNGPAEEYAIASEELRALARGRLVRLVRISRTPRRIRPAGCPHG